MFRSVTQAMAENFGGKKETVSTDPNSATKRNAEIQCLANKPLK